MSGAPRLSAEPHAEQARYRSPPTTEEPRTRDRAIVTVGPDSRDGIRITAETPRPIPISRRGPDTPKPLRRSRPRVARPVQALLEEPRRRGDPTCAAMEVPHKSTGRFERVVAYARVKRDVFAAVEEATWHDLAAHSLGPLDEAVELLLSAGRARW